MELAKILEKGIEDEVIYIIPPPVPEEMLRLISERIINYTTPEGMKKQEETARRNREEMTKRRGGKNPFEGADEAGWGKAREDLTWIKGNS